MESITEYFYQHCLFLSKNFAEQIPAALNYCWSIRQPLLALQVFFTTVYFYGSQIVSFCSEVMG